ncbi:MAG: hypothetical protein IMY86_01660, partial [Chloroflexi bacterium]|nr:hypothetical protein [Chloroflexota bacterium]
MNRLVRYWIPGLISIVVFLFVLLGYMFPTALAFDYRDQRTGLHDILIEWAVIVAAFAFLLGLFNIFRVHVRQMARLQQGGVYSLVFLLAALTSLALSLAGPEREATRWMFT